MVQTKKNLNPFTKIVSEIASLKRLYPEGKLVYNNKLSFTWEMDVKPTPLSIVYRIKIVYRYGDIPKVYIVSPFPLDRYPGKSLLPHVYSTKEQVLEDLKNYDISTICKIVAGAFERAISLTNNTNHES